MERYKRGEPDYDPRNDPDVIFGVWKPIYAHWARNTPEFKQFLAGKLKRQPPGVAQPDHPNT